MIIEGGQATNLQGCRLPEESDPTQIRTLNLQQDNDFKVDAKNPHIILIGESDGVENHNLHVYDYSQKKIIHSLKMKKSISHMEASPTADYLFLNYEKGTGVLNKLTMKKLREDIEKKARTIKLECAHNCVLYAQ